MIQTLHIDNLLKNLTEVLRLAEIHQQLTGARRGRRHNVAILNKSGIVLVVSCWEAFVEDLAAQSFSWLLSNARSPDAFPRKVLTLASKEVREADDTRRVWELAETGWRSVLERHRGQILLRSAGKLNTPRPKQVDELFADLLGLAMLSDSWRWGGVPNGRVKKSLEDLVTLRGEIAHRVEASRPVLKRDVESASELVEKLAVCSSNTVRTFLMTRVADRVEPWVKF